MIVVYIARRQHQTDDWRMKPYSWPMTDAIFALEDASWNDGPSNSIWIVPGTIEG